MKTRNTMLALVVALAVGLAHAGDVNESKPATNDAADQLTAFAAGYCKGMADKHGMDFVACFTRVTDLAIEQLQALETQVKKD